MENETDRKRWSKKFVSNAILYDIDTEFRYGLIRNNTFYNNTRGGYLTLDMNPKLRAFFVPMHTDLKKNQEIGQEVNWI